jgi:iron complex transport system permease protein
MNDVPAGSAATAEYLRHSKKKRMMLAALLLLAAVAALFTLRLGSTELSYMEILKIMAPGQVGGENGWWNEYVVWNLRLPIIVSAILVGASLGAAGAVMQGILRNPLASPFTLGLSNAAAFGASIGIMATTGRASAMSLFASGISGQAIIVALAFLFALLAAAAVILLVKFVGAAPETIILAGLAISAIFASGLAFLQYLANDVQLSSMVFWQFGSLDKMSWKGIWALAATFGLAAAYFMYKALDYNVMETGDETARSLGVNVSASRMAGLAASAFVTAVAVSFAGIIGFVGLLAPHAARSLTGGDNRYLLPGSMLVGALVLLAANMLGQHTFGVAVPIGIITSAVGGPMFLYILIRRKRGA